MLQRHPPTGIVTLLTDFGTADHYVGVMKGVILATAPGVTVVNLSHEVAAGSVAEGAYLLLASYSYFPPGTVHVAVVDPGVGTARRAVIVDCAGQYFVGPDNGIFSYLLDREPDAHVYRISNDHPTDTLASTTFHGRDLFAPAGAALARDGSPAKLGEPVADAVRLPPIRPSRGSDGALHGRILHVDRFGNCITNFASDDLPADESLFRVQIGRAEISALRRSYAEATDGEPFLIWGSSGFLEFSVNRGSAAERLTVSSGDPVTMRFDRERDGAPAPRGKRS